jgi:hypothetical protein
MVTLLHVAAPTTALVVQSWWHVKVAGVNAPSVQTIAVAPGLWQILHPELVILPSAVQVMVSEVGVTDTGPEEP